MQYREKRVFLQKIENMEKLIRFDWAIKRLLRNKANHEVIEGLLESLLGEKFTIEEFLESESNMDSETDKFNRVDILAKDTKGQLFIFEIQNDHELSYFHRILYGTSKVITQYMQLGQDYSNVKKIYSINIVYLDLWQGKDYVYRGSTEFRGLHDDNDVLKLSPRQNKIFFSNREANKNASDIFPIYYLFLVNNFDKVATTPLDEWIEFLKTDEVKLSAKAPGLTKVRECMRYDSLTDEEKRAYERYLDAVRYQRSVIGTGWDEGREEGFKEGLKIGFKEIFEKNKMEGDKAARLSIALRMKKVGMSPQQIADMTNLPLEEIKNIPL